MISTEVALFLVAASAITLVFAVKRLYGGRHAASLDSENPSSGVTDRLIVHAEPPAHEDLRAMIYSCAKIELHCHLNGSVRKETLRELLGVSSDSINNVVHTIDDAFAQFKKVYEAVNSESSLRRIIRELLDDSVADNIRYLELRTTPRKLNDVISQKDYVGIAVDEISKFPKLNRLQPLSSFPVDQIAVRLILTVDRAQPVAAAEQVIDIALRFPGTVVGIDFAGNPKQGSFEKFRSAFERARGHGLFITVHTSEIKGVSDETDAILNFKPNRIGHFLFPTEAQIKRAKDLGIPIESCPTSNICAMYGESPSNGEVEGHSLLGTLLRDSSALISINTDDPRIFGVKLSDEIYAVAKSFKLTRQETRKLISNAVYHAFLSQAEKRALVEALDITFYRSLSIHTVYVSFT